MLISTILLSISGYSRPSSEDQETEEGYQSNLIEH